jgi:uncharacterized protein YlxW (UPF0749 family)
MASAEAANLDAFTAKQAAGKLNLKKVKDQTYQMTETVYDPDTGIASEKQETFELSKVIEQRQKLQEQVEKQQAQVTRLQDMIAKLDVFIAALQGTE